MEKDSKNLISFSANNLEITSNSNKMYIIGCICTIGTSSEDAPCGTDNKKTILSQKGADSCIKSFIGQPMNCIFDEWGYTPEIFSGHGSKYSGMYFGFIEDAWQEENKLMAKIVVWKDTFPELAATIINAQRSLGFSVELYPTESYEDTEGNIVIDKWEAAGCALLWRKCAAWGEETYIEKLVASLQKLENDKKSEGDTNMTKEEMASIAAMLSAEVTKSLGIDEIKASINDLKKHQEENKKPDEDKVEVQKQGKEDNENKSDGDTLDKIKKLEATIEQMKEKMEANKNIPTPKSYTGNSDVGEGQETYINKLKKIDASNATSDMKIRQKIKVHMEASQNGVALDSLYNKLGEELPE